MKKAFELSERGIMRGCEPGGCVIMNKTTGEICGKAHNMVALHNDPTMHAEIIAIREACHFFQSADLSGCTMYLSNEPCLMCIGAMHLAKIETIYVARPQN
jgi:tRNA(Arg) A34 adenosine deaminase TadA